MNDWVFFTLDKVGRKLAKEVKLMHLFTETVSIVNVMIFQYKKLFSLTFSKFCYFNIGLICFFMYGKWVFDFSGNKRT